MKINIIYDNTTTRDDLPADWGFACLVETDDGHRILFDTGTNGALLLANMQALGIDPATIDDVFISHAHFDHIGGLSTFLNANRAVRAFCPKSLRGVHGAAEVIEVDHHPRTIHAGVSSTGELEGIEQSLVIETPQGNVLVVGCSHPKMATILQAASQFGPVCAIVGGLHACTEFDLFKDLSCICPTHCTQHIAEIKQRYPQAFTPGGAGRVLAF